MEDCIAVDCLNGAFGLMYVDGGTVRRVSSLGGGLGTKYPYVWSGSALAFLQACKYVTIDDCEFSDARRGDAADACGIDFEGDNENCTMTNTVIGDNDGPAVLSLSTGGNNVNLQITNCTFYNNSRSPWNSEANSEMESGAASNTGAITNCGMYRRATTVNFLSASWGGFTQSGNRQLEYPSYSGLSRWWNFDAAGNFEGWNTFNQWLNAAVSGGSLNGNSSGGDPYAVSGTTFANANDNRYAWIRLKSTAGTTAQVFYVTDTDPAWNETKSKWFTVTADNAFHDYFVDLEDANLKGVIKAVRLDPTTASGAAFAVDFVRLTWTTDPGQPAPPAPPAASTVAVFTSQSAYDGYITESTQTSEVGGSVNSSGTTMRLGDTTSKQSTRLILSFDTSAIPDTAVIDKAFVKLTRTSQAGTSPWSWVAQNSNPCRVDIRQGDFGGSATLATGDYAAAPSAGNVGRLLIPYSNGLVVIDELTATGNSYINKTGRTQFKVRMEQQDNNDAVSDYVEFGTGNNGTAANRPVLEVWYH